MGNLTKSLRAAITLLASAAAAMLLTCALWPAAAMADSRAVSVAFDANGPAAEIYVTSELDQVSVPEIELDFEGFEFTGEWNTERDGSGDAYAAGDAVTESVTLYAQWEDGSYLDESSSGSDGSDQDDSDAASASSGSDSVSADDNSATADADAADSDENSAASTAVSGGSSSGSSGSSSPSGAYDKAGASAVGIAALAGALALTAAALLLARRHVKGEE